MAIQPWLTFEAVKDLQVKTASSGYQEITLAANLELTAEDAGTILVTCDTTSLTLTIPSGLPVGLKFEIINAGASSESFTLDWVDDNSSVAPDNRKIIFVTSADNQSLGGYTLT